MPFTNARQIHLHQNFKNLKMWFAETKQKMIKTKMRTKGCYSGRDKESGRERKTNIIKKGRKKERKINREQR
jgi:hypothetical protein